MENVLNQIREQQLGRLEENVSFKTLTTYKTGGNARAVVFPYDVLKLQELLSILKENNISYKIFGNGSNILASDKDYDGVIIKLNNLNNIEKIDDFRFKVDAGVNLILLANKMCKEGLSGLEFACGIPGSVGGSIYMNAGAYLSDMSNVIESVCFIDKDGNIKEKKRSEMEFSYRNSPFMNSSDVILSAVIKLEKGDVSFINKLIEERKQRRVESQPLEYPSAGSVFRNPVGNYAGKLIEDANLKGKVVGGAMISDKHANFIVNRDNATSTDIKSLMDLAESEVEKNFNIKLHREQELFNWE